MAVIDDLRQAAVNALSAGATATRAQGAALKADFEILVKPQLDDILAQIAAITADFISGNISKQQAQDDLHAQGNRIKPIILGEAELTFLAVQTIVNSVLNAVKSTVNATVGIALL